jgi:ketosteroid isomerase-like protein
LNSPAVTEDEVRGLLDGYAAWNKRDPDVLTELLDPEMGWDAGFLAPEAGRHRGAESFRQFVDSWIESFDEFRIQPELLVQVGDKVVVVAHQEGRGRGSGIALQARVVHVWTIKDGKAIGWWGPRTVDEALEALGDPRPAVLMRGYEAFNCGEIDEALALFDPEVVWHTWIVPGPGGATYRGHDGVRELWSDARNVFGDFRNEPERIIAAGDKLVVFVNVRGRGKESGAEVEGRIAHVLAFRESKVTAVESYEDRDEALRVVGVG